MRFRVTLDGHFISTSGELDEEAREALGVAMDELNKLGAAAGNAAIELTMASGEIMLTCAIEADDPVAAVQPASDNIYLALNKANIGTPNWPGIDDPHWRVEFINSRAEALVG
jgi:hypothetical protein